MPPAINRPLPHLPASCNFFAFPRGTIHNNSHSTYSSITRCEKPTTATAQSRQLYGDTTMKLVKMTCVNADGQTKTLRTLSPEECRAVGGRYSPTINLRIKTDTNVNMASDNPSKVWDPITKYS